MHSQLDLGESEAELEQRTVCLVTSLQLYGKGDPLFCCQEAHLAVNFCGSALQGPPSHATRSAYEATQGCSRREGSSHSSLSFHWSKKHNADLPEVVGTLQRGARKPLTSCKLASL